MCDFDLNQLFCCWTNRQLGVKVIGFFYFVINFSFIVWPIYEINYFRSNDSVYDNTTFVQVPMLANGGYEQLLVANIIFFLIGIVCSAMLVWGAMQVPNLSIYLSGIG